MRMRPAVLLIGVSTALGGCDMLGIGEYEFVVRVDSISAPPAVGAGDTLHVRFFGWVGSDSCSRISEVEKQVTGERLEIRFRGIRRSGHCKQMPVTLDHHESVLPPLADPFTITALQPAGGPLERLVQVDLRSATDR